MDDTKNTQKQHVIREKAFATRLEIACENHPHCPTDQPRGKQKWIYDNLLEQFGIKLSPEAVRRYFSGEMKPRHKTMIALARLLEVDVSWLALGTAPDMTPKERKVRDATADGAVNLVAGIIQTQGGHVAFPEGESTVDLFAIIGGKQRSIEVALALDLAEDMMRFRYRDSDDDRVVIGVIKTDGLNVQLLRLNPAFGEVRGDFAEMKVERGAITLRFSAWCQARLLNV